MDLLALLFGPHAYLAGRNTVTHSLISIALVVAIGSAFAIACTARFPKRAALASDHAAGDLTTVVLATSLAAIAHLLMDLAGSSGIGLLWPFRATRFAWDYLPETDPWILASLLAGIFLPELFRLVGSEIGAKQKSPRGRNGALIALALVVFYVGGRAILHGNAAAQLDAHSYRGESPRQVCAFPDSLSPVTWRAVVETTSQICLADVQGAEIGRVEPESAVCRHTPEESAALTAAQKTRTAREFLQAARFPKASVSATADGLETVLRDMRDVAQNETLHALAGRILLDRSGQVISESIVWVRSVKLR